MTKKMRPLHSCSARRISRFFRQNFFWFLKPAPGELVEEEKKILAKKKKSRRADELCNGLKMKGIIVAFLFVTSSIFAEHSIVFVHIGKEVPAYTEVAISQARLFNPQANIILLSSKRALKRYNAVRDKYNVLLYAYEDVPKTSIHKSYQARCAETTPFWRYTSERFLYLWDFIKAHSLENVFHLENDNMLYADLGQLLPLFQEHYPGIGATFDNEERCIPGFVWIANKKAMKGLAKYFAKEAPKRLSDMAVIASYRTHYSRDKIDALPIIMPEYRSSHPLESPHHHTTNCPERYSNHCDNFHAIFDAASIGQFLGGIDPIHANNQPGFINESCLFNPSLLEYQWLLDEEKRKVPYVIFEGRQYKIINLHIHSKRLHAFQS